LLFLKTEDFFVKGERKEETLQVLEKVMERKECPIGARKKIGTRATCAGIGFVSANTTTISHPEP